MTTPPADPRADLPVPTPRQPRPKPDHRKRRLVLIAGAIAVLSAIAVWQATSELPFVQHREAITMALALESAKSVEQVRALVHVDARAPRIALPGMPAPPAAAVEWISQLKSTHHYTFLGVAGERSDQVRLRFRVHSEQEGAEKLLVDYQDFHLGRVGGVVVVDEVRSLLCGESFWALVREEERLAAHMASPEGKVFTAALAGTEPAAMLAAFRALPDPARRGTGAATALLSALTLRDLGPGRDAVFRDAVTELGRLHPDDRTIDLWLLYHVQAHGIDDRTRGDAIHAVERLAPRVEDGDWMRSALKKLKG